jgi:hypothetical protein
MTHDTDVMVYANSSEIKIKVAPVEVFIQISAHKARGIDVMMDEMRLRLTIWKQEHIFSHPINLTLIPMDWSFQIGI